jgi:hypothetical protein
MTPLSWTAWLVAAGTPVFVPWAGHLETAEGVPVDGTVSAAFVVTDAATGDVLLDAFDATLPVVDGTFVVDVPVPAAPDGAGTAELTVVVNGDSFPPVSIVATTPVVAFADHADDADDADDADALDGLSDPVTLAALLDGSSAGARVAFANVTGVPTGFLDGDDGIAFVPDASFSFEDGVLTLLPRGVSAANVGALDGNRLADASVNATHIAPGTLTANDITGVLPVSKVAAGTFGIDAFSTATTAVEVFEVHVDRCDAPRGTLQVDSTCTFTGLQNCTTTFAGNPVNGFTDCTGLCRPVNGTSCALPSAGFVVFP